MSKPEKKADNTDNKDKASPSESEQSKTIKHYPLRQGLRHEAMLNIFSKEILENFFSYSLIKLMMKYLPEEDGVQTSMRKAIPQQAQPKKVRGST